MRTYWAFNWKEVFLKGRKRIHLLQYKVTLIMIRWRSTKSLGSMCSNCRLVMAFTCLITIVIFFQNKMPTWFMSEKQSGKALTKGNSGKYEHLWFSFIFDSVEILRKSAGDVGGSAEALRWIESCEFSSFISLEVWKETYLVNVSFIFLRSCFWHTEHRISVGLIWTRSWMRCVVQMRGWFKFGPSS